MSSNKSYFYHNFLNGLTESSSRTGTYSDDTQKFYGLVLKSGVNGTYFGEMKKRASGRGVADISDGTTRDGIWKDGDFIKCDKQPRKETNVLD